MSDLYDIGSRLNPTTRAFEFYDKATGRTVAAFEAAFGPTYTAVFTATLAQINAGYTFVAADANRTILPVSVRLLCTGAFAALTDIRISDTAASPVDILTLAQAQATNGAIVTDAGGSGITIGAGFAAALTAGKGLQIRQTGSAGTTATSASGIVQYLLV